MANKTVGKVEDGNQDVQNLAMLAGVACIIVFYIQLLQNRKYWITMEACLGVLYALIFPFAGLLSSVFAKETDLMTIYMMRLMLVTFVAHAAAVYLTQKSSDRVVPIAVSISSILARGPIVMLLVLAINSGQFLTKQKEYTYIDAAVQAFLLFGDVVFMAKAETRKYKSRTVGDPISFHLSVDALITFFLGSLLLGFPDMFCSIVNPGLKASEYLFLNVKAIGIMILSGSMLSFASLCYRDDDDAINTLKTKLVVYLPTMLLAMTNMLIDSHFRTYGHAALMVGLTGGLVLNAGSMVYRHEKED